MVDKWRHSATTILKCRNERKKEQNNKKKKKKKIFFFLLQLKED